MCLCFLKDSTPYLRGKEGAINIYTGSIDINKDNARQIRSDGQMGITHTKEQNGLS